VDFRITHLFIAAAPRTRQIDQKTVLGKTNTAVSALYIYIYIYALFYTELLY
jgi:hypothetical protein